MYNRNTNKTAEQTRTIFLRTLKYPMRQVADHLENERKIKRNVETLQTNVIYFSKDKSAKVYEYDSNSINFPDANRRDPDATDRHTANNSFEPSLSSNLYSLVLSLSVGRKGGKVTLNSRISIYLSPVERRRVLSQLRRFSPSVSSYHVLLRLRLVAP